MKIYSNGKKKVFSVSFQRWDEKDHKARTFATGERGYEKLLLSSFGVIIKIYFKFK
jgi:hypothetical protein